jgi:RNA polymerase sigma factor (sigma-70 family)
MIEEISEPPDIPEEDQEIERLYAKARKEAKIATYPSKKEMRLLNDRRLRGDDKAREEMIVRNLPLVHWFVHKTCGIGPNFDDNIQYGSMGLMIAVDRFDPTKGEGNFGTYAMWWIRQKIRLGYHYDLNTIRIPVNERPQIQRLRDLIEDIKIETGQKPSLKELMEKTGFSARRIRKLLLAPLSTSSLDAPIADGEDSESRYSTIPNPESRPPSERLASREDFIIVTNRIRDICRQLEYTYNKRIQTVRWPTIVYKKIGLYGYGPEGNTLEAIGLEYGVTRERIRQICVKTMRPVGVRKLVPNGMDGFAALVRFARQSLDTVFGEAREIPSDILFLLGYPTNDTKE